MGITIGNAIIHHPRHGCPPSSRAVLRLWQAWHSGWRFESSSVPPWDRATMWSTSVAGVTRPALAHSRQRGSSRSMAARSLRHAVPYPRLCAVPRRASYCCARALARASLRCSACERCASQYPDGSRVVAGQPAQRHGRIGRGGICYPPLPTPSPPKGCCGSLCVCCQSGTSCELSGLRGYSDRARCRVCAPSSRMHHIRTAPVYPLPRRCGRSAAGGDAAAGLSVTNC